MREQQIEAHGLRAITVGERDDAALTIVLLHGFGMTPAELAPFAHSLALPAWYVFPEGPVAASIGGRAWWQIDAVARAQALERGARDFATQHPPDLPAARARLDAFLDGLDRDGGGRPLVLGGFSQGGMLSCDTLLRGTRSVAGLALLSASRIAFDEWPPLLAAGRVRGLPTLISHGAADADLAFAAGEALRDCLIAAGADVTWVAFEQGHEIPLVVWRRLRKFLGAAGARREPGSAP